MSWQILTAIGVLTFSVSILLRRVLLHDDKSDPIAYTIVFQGLVGVITGIYALIHGFQMPDFGRYWFAILLTCLLYPAAHIISSYTLKLVEASTFAILFATSAIWTMFAGFFIYDYSFGFMQLIGIVLIFVSVLALIEDKKSLKLSRGTMLGLLSGVLFGFAVAGWAYVGKHADVPSWNALSFLGPCLFVIIARPKALLNIKPFFVGKVFIRMVVLAVIFSISGLASLSAYSTGNVSIIPILQQTGIIVTTILGVIFLHERNRLWHKVLAAAICFVGVLLVI